MGLVVPPLVDEEVADFFFEADEPLVEDSAEIIRRRRRIMGAMTQHNNTQHNDF
jgi:hypothetical protein